MVSLPTLEISLSFFFLLWSMRIFSMMVKLKCFELKYEFLNSSVLVHCYVALKEKNGRVNMFYVKSYTSYRKPTGLDLNPVPVA